MLIIFRGQTFVLTHFVLMLSTLDFFESPLYPSLQYLLVPIITSHSLLLMDSLSLSLHTIMFYSAIFLFPLGEVIDMIRVILDTSTRVQRHPHCL